MGLHDGGSNGRTEISEIARGLHARIWAMASADDTPAVLMELSRALDRLKIPRESARVFLVGADGRDCSVRRRSLDPDDNWTPLADEPLSCLVEMWKSGAAARRVCELPDSDGAGTELQRAATYAGTPVASLLELPFSHGVLGLYSADPNAFDETHLRGLEPLELVLSALFSRAADLESLRSKERQLRHVQRLQLVGQLTAEVAQDLNDPLWVILSECDLLLEQPLDREVADALQAISSAGRQAQAVGHRLLEFVRGAKTTTEWVNFNRLVQESVELIRHAFTKEQIELEEDMARNLPWIQAHVGQVQQIVLNLLQNAREALSSDRTHGMVRVRTYTRSGRVYLEIEDNGPGVEADAAESIFDPFFTTKSRVEASGLGLSVCAGIAREHGGQLRLQPRVMGTCVCLELPVRHESCAASN